MEDGERIWANDLCNAIAMRRKDAKASWPLGRRRSNWKICCKSASACKSVCTLPIAVKHRSYNIRFTWEYSFIARNSIGFRSVVPCTEWVSHVGHRKNKWNQRHKVKDTTPCLELARSTEVRYCQKDKCMDKLKRFWFSASFITNQIIASRTSVDDDWADRKIFATNCCTR